jgi:hypothetical protein
MKYKILLPLLISGLFFGACSKDEAKTEVPGDTILETYYPGTTMEIKELSIRTRDGVITDPAVIQDFINRNVSFDARSQFYVGMSSVPVPQSTQILHFLNNNRVNVNGVNMEIKGYKDSVMLVSEYVAAPFPTYATTCGALLGKVLEFSAFSECPDGNCASYRRTFPLIVSGVNYYAPLLTYAVVTKECAITPTEIPVIGIINQDLNLNLVAGDSVLVQYAKLPLLKDVTAK